MHGIRGKVKFPRPRNGIMFNTDLRELRGVRKNRENTGFGGVDECAHINQA